MFGFGKPNIEKMEKKKNVKGLIRALRDETDRQVRKDAAKALGNIGDARSVEPLIKALSDSDKDVRYEAYCALENIGTPAVETLIKFSNDPENRDKDIRAEVVRILGKMGGERAVEALSTALHSDNQNVRGEAFEALGTRGNEWAIEHLTSILSNCAFSNWTDRSKAAETLEKIGWRPGKDEIAAYYWIVKREWNKCIEIGTFAVEPLIEALRDFNKGSMWIRRNAAKALGEIRDQRAVKPLIEALSDPDSMVRRLAAEALENIGDARAVEPLFKALGDPDKDVRKAVAKALEKFGLILGKDRIAAQYWISKEEWSKCVEIGAPAIEPLIKTLSDSNYIIRKQAATSLIQLYKNGGIDQYNKNIILGKMDYIKRSHTDYNFSSDCNNGNHTDIHHDSGGIGLDFPL